MSMSDAASAEDEQDWTQITQPRIRKRVQNRLSQRKHRNKVRQQLETFSEAGPLNSTASIANTGNSISPRSLFVPNEDQSWQTQRQPCSNVSYGESQSAIPGSFDSWHGLNGLNATNSGTIDVADLSSSTSSPASLWPVSGASTTQTFSSLNEASFPPLISESEMPPLARPGTASPGPQWRVVGVQKLSPSNRGHIQPATAGYPGSTTIPTPVPPPISCMSPHTSIGPSPQHTKQTNRPPSSQSMQILHNNHLSPQSCSQCGCHNPHAYSIPPMSFEHAGPAPAIAMNPAPLSPTLTSPGFDLSKYGIDISSLPDGPIAQAHNNGSPEVYMEEHHRGNSSHYSDHGHICGCTQSQLQQQVTQHMPQQAPRQESNADQGQERVILVYLQSTSQAA